MAWPTLAISCSLLERNEDRPYRSAEVQKYFEEVTTANPNVEVTFTETFILEVWHDILYTSRFPVRIRLASIITHSVLL